MVNVDIPYLVTDNWWDSETVFNKGAMRDMFSGFNEYTFEDSVVKVYSAHQQLNPVKKRLEKQTDLKVSKNPYFWLYPRLYYKVRLKAFFLTFNRKLTLI